MARMRFVAVALLALTLAGNSTQTGRSQNSTSGLSLNSTGWTAPVPATDERTCVIYALDEMGFDAELGKWIAQTIPVVLEPGSWKDSGVLRYYAPKNVLIVNHLPKMQEKVSGFLKNLKSSLAKERENHMAMKAVPRTVVMPASYRAPTAYQAPSPSEPSLYPVPAPVKAPKHLFHFIIRYEGEGIIDDNVVKFMKLQTQGEKKKDQNPASALLNSITLPSAPSKEKEGEEILVAPKEKEEKPEKKKDKEEKPAEESHNPFEQP